MMLVIGQQDSIDVRVTEGGVIVLKQDSLEHGHKVEIFIQPENLGLLANHLIQVKNDLAAGLTPEQVNDE